MSSTATAYDRVVEALRTHGASVRDNGTQAVANCPAHDDRHPSLGITRIEGSVLIHCHSQQCHIDNILAGLDLTARDLYDEPNGATYRYDDGRLVHRSPEKRFRQAGNTGGRPQLYRLAKVREAVAAGHPVYLVEGEKDVHAVEAVGGVATTAPMGAANFTKVDATPLAGATVIVVPDRDTAGYTYARDAVATLTPLAAAVTIRLPAVGKDVADHIAAGLSLDQLEPAELFADKSIETLFPRCDLVELLSDDWPEREDVVARLVPAGASVSVVAPPGNGKSLVALAISTAVVDGANFAGLRVPKARRVLYVDAENNRHDLRERLLALGWTTQTVERLHRLTLLHLPPLTPLDTAAGGAELLAILNHYQIDDGDVLVLDSTQRVICGPENDSDTARAYYRYTGQPLKARGVTVLRLDNMGKDPSKGARGTSSKRDDVDLEWLLTKAGDLLTFRVAKARLPDVSDLTLRMRDDDGGLRFELVADPFVAAAHAAMADLDRLDVPHDASQRACQQALQDAGIRHGRAAIRAAAKQRHDRSDSAPTLFGAPPPADCADAERRATAHTGQQTRFTQVSSGLACAEPDTARDGAVQQSGAPFAPSSEEGRTRRAPSSTPQTKPCPVCGLVDFSADRAGCDQCLATRPDPVRSA